MEGPARLRVKLRGSKRRPVDSNSQTPLRLKSKIIPTVLPMRSANLRVTLPKRILDATPPRRIITGPRFTPVVQALPSIVPFVAPDEIERSRGQKFSVRLGANELTFGPSPRAVEAMQAAAATAWMYGDPKSHNLRQALADHHGVQPLNITVGEGIDGILCNLTHLLIGPGDKLVTTKGTYPTLNYFVAGKGGMLQTVPYGPDDRQDLSALLAKAWEVDAKVLYVVNPDNPSGSWHAEGKIESLIEGLPPGCLLLLDEAYHELGVDFDANAKVAVDDLRVLRLRTFSKAYGLAGARIGYALGAPEIIAAFDKIRNHFAISRVGQAGALAALLDQTYLLEVRERVRYARETLGNIAAQHGMRCLPSATNFVTMDCGKDGAFARLVLSELTERNVFVRMPGVPPLDRCIRVSCSSDEDLRIFREALPGALKDAERKLGSK